MAVKQLTKTGPVWEIATLFPEQGAWSESEYLALDTNHLVEFSHGNIEVLPMPSQTHQLIVLFLWSALTRFLKQRKSADVVLVAPFRVRLQAGKYREPDLMLMQAEHIDRRHNVYWDGADLVMEVVSPDARDRDFKTKRSEYALAGIPEYWIVDPQFQRVTVLSLAGESYAEHGVFARGETATSVLLDGFAVSVDEIFDSAE
jgi:Uma2 family endonuclease